MTLIRQESLGRRDRRQVPAIKVEDDQQQKVDDSDDERLSSSSDFELASALDSQIGEEDTNRKKSKFLSRVDIKGGTHSKSNIGIKSQLQR